jgi:RNA polymerase sigma factor
VTEARLLNRVEAAQQGSESAREALIEENRKFIARVVSQFCNRHVDDHSDEFSIGLIAFNEAIDGFRKGAGRSFLSYCAMVIKRRLIDYVRKESRHNTVSLDTPPKEDQEGMPNQAEIREAWRQYQREMEIRERSRELQYLNSVLEEYGFDLQDLQNGSPTHRKTRENLVEVAEELVSNPELRDYLLRTKRLPLKELSEASGASHKVLKTWRRYIVTLAVILTTDRFEFLRSYFEFGERRDRHGTA